MTEPHKGGSSVLLKQHLGGIVAAEIVPDETLKDKQAWLRLVRALRSDRAWQLIYAHRAKMSAHLDNVVRFPGGER